MVVGHFLIRLNDLRQSQQYADDYNSEHERDYARDEQLTALLRVFDLFCGAGDCWDIFVAVEVVFYKIVGRDAEKLA
ncbi:MAG: hypothetical protein KHZ33_03985 [Ruminococcus sp.]|nr:hypothetical protein [Ruminococcus sp.]